MTTYALIHTADDGNTTLQSLREFPQTPPLLNPAKGLQWLPYVDTPRPAFDPLTHGLRELDVNTANGRAVRVWEVFPLPVEEATARQLGAFIAALEAHFDAAAQSRRYDNRLTCALRAGYPGPFQAEGAAFATWMDTCNAYAYSVLAQVQAGTRPVPDTPAALVAELPALTWPDAV